MLLVAAVLSHGSDAGEPARLLLTDGWHYVAAVLDNALALQLVRDRIFLGQKLHTVGARLLDPDAQPQVRSILSACDCATPAPMLCACAVRVCVCLKV